MGRVSVEVLEAPARAEGASKQLDLAKFAYDEHRCVAPPVDPQVLAQLYSRNVAHKACVDAKSVNTVGLGWSLEAKDGADSGDADLRDLVIELEAWLDLLARRDGESFTDLLLAAKKDEEAVGSTTCTPTHSAAAKTRTAGSRRWTGTTSTSATTAWPPRTQNRPTGSRAPTSS
ncbi:MAG: hypothetical protein M1325_00745 [Actinobacteria bacterium]|nr:hypothetical protein [Actinomycetota bacterium]